MKGMSYSPTPIGMTAEQPPYGDFFTTNHRSLYRRDLPLMRQMGVNCVRVYGWSTTDDHTEFLDQAYNGGKRPIYVLINRWVDPNTDWSSAAAVGGIKTDWQTIATAAKNHPAVLGYAIGNELNFANGQNPQFWSALNDIAGAIKNVDASHIITTPLGDGNLVSGIQAYDATVSNLNCWSVQMFRGINFGTFFTDYSSASGKPLFVLEFGIDSWNANTAQEYPTNAALQAAYIQNLWNQIVASSNIVSGGAVFEWCDEWWKSGNPSSHEAGGWNNNSFPDHTADEEWWGIHRITNGNPNVLQPRAAYATLQNLWFVSASAPVLSNPNLSTSGNFQFTVSGTPGCAYAVLSSTDLQQWTPRQTNFPPFVFTETNVFSLSRRDYRAMYVPE